MIVAKDGITLNLENQSHIDAYLSSGWVEAKASAPAAQEEPKAEEPVVDFMPEPVVPNPEVGEARLVAPAPKRGRKKQER